MLSTPPPCFLCHLVHVLRHLILYMLHLPLSLLTGETDSPRLRPHREVGLVGLPPLMPTHATHECTPEFLDTRDANAVFCAVEKS